ncbi:UNVERIFIED_CONTAM: hypothetical protein GTU68_042667 [Idotea baltica]|nr:hypothetical protein [Idotea baltica]
MILSHSNVLNVAIHAPKKFICSTIYLLIVILSHLSVLNAVMHVSEKTI